MGGQTRMSIVGLWRSRWRCLCARHCFRFDTMCQFAPTEIVGFWIPSRVTFCFHWQQPLYVFSSSERIFVALHLIGAFVPLGEVFVEVQFSMTCRFYCSHLGSFARPKCCCSNLQERRTV